MVFRPAFLVPVYNHEHAIAAVVESLLPYSLPILLVDDGSAAACAQVLEHLAAINPEQVFLERLPQNQGKGAAACHGFRYLFEHGYSHALMLDADGQHDSTAIPTILKSAEDNPSAMIMVDPVFDANIPKKRLYGRYATHVMVWLNTWSLDIRDALCGYRLYPLAATMAQLAQRAPGARMEFDPELAVRLYWRGTPVVNVPARVYYPKDGVSHFRLWQDNVRISWLHTRLFFGMLIRIPSLLRRRISTDSVKASDQSS